MGGSLAEPIIDSPPGLGIGRESVQKRKWRGGRESLSKGLSSQRDFPKLQTILQDDSRKNTDELGRASPSPSTNKPRFHSTHSKRGDSLSLPSTKAELHTVPVSPQRREVCTRNIVI